MSTLADTSSSDHRRVRHIIQFGWHAEHEQQLPAPPATVAELPGVQGVQAVQWIGATDLQRAPATRQNTMTNKLIFWQVRPSSETAVYPHMPILRPHTPRDIPRTSHLYRTNRPARGPRGFVRFWASGGAKFPKICDCLRWTPMNRRAKFDAASFVLGGEIRKRTNKHKQ